ncbi:ankyrin repeat domain-containing protein [Candidatus Babeliales bacterium]|nr:ankyrin repeat domain-containing protein [Candidatus Babeliales bacterium]
MKKLLIGLLLVLPLLSANLKSSLFRNKLHEAAIEGSYFKAFALISRHGYDVNEKDKPYLASPLHYAAKFGHLPLVTLFVEKGAEVNSKNCVFNTPLHLAVRENNYRVAVFLIWKGANPLAKNILGKTALDLAIESGNKKLIDLLENISVRVKEIEEEFLNNK